MASPERYPRRRPGAGRSGTRRRNRAAGSYEQERGTLVRIKRTAGMAVVLVFALALAACGSSSNESTTSSAASTTAGHAVKKIAFFGFWKSNSFTKAVLDGVKQAADKAGAEVVD